MLVLFVHAHGVELILIRSVSLGPISGRWMRTGFNKSMTKHNSSLHLDRIETHCFHYPEYRKTHFGLTTCTANTWELTSFSCKRVGRNGIHDSYSTLCNVDIGITPGIQKTRGNANTINTNLKRKPLIHFNMLIEVVLILFAILSRCFSP